MDARRVRCASRRCGSPRSRRPSDESLSRVGQIRLLPVALPILGKRVLRQRNAVGDDVNVAYNLHPPMLKAIGMESKKEVPAKVANPALRLR